MKTESQIERDKKAGVLNLEHSFDKKSGKILSKGLIRKEIDPETLIGALEPIKQKLNQMRDDIARMKILVESAPVTCSESVENFLEIQKEAAEWNRAQSARAQLKQRVEEYDVLTDDLVEQEKLLEEYIRWKK